jgi:HK97 family phage major capsid protein
MLRDNLIEKMKELRNKMAQDKGSDLVSTRAQFDEAQAEVNRIDAEAAAELKISSAHERRDDQLWEGFGRLLKGEPVSDLLRDALSVRDEKLREHAGRFGFRAPGSARDWLSARNSGPVSARATTTTPGAPLGIISSDISDMIPGATMQPLISLPLPPSPIFDAATKVDALNGTAQPFLDQTAQDPFAGVSITVGGAEGRKKGRTSLNVDAGSITVQEYNAICVVSDLALRRAPQYETAIQQVFRSALAYQVDQDLITAILAGATAVTRVGANTVQWADLIHLKKAIPWFWNVTGAFGFSQNAQAYLEETLTWPSGFIGASVGSPMYSESTAATMRAFLAGKNWFLDGLPDLGVEGDVIFGNYANSYVGVGQDIVFRRSSDGYTLMESNSTAFAVFAHLGVGVPIGEVFAKLDDSVTTTSGT